MEKVITPQDTMIAHHRESDGAIQILEQHLRGVASARASARAKIETGETIVVAGPHTFVSGRRGHKPLLSYNISQ